MANKKEKDVLDDILGGSQDSSTQGMKDLTELLYRRGRPSAKSPPKTKKRVRVLKQREQEKRPAKKKATYYISKKVSVELSEAKAKIRVMVPPELKSRVSLSRIVNVALKFILKELEAKGQKSPLVKSIIGKNQEK